MGVNWRNPYSRCTGKWLKGNLHTHTSDGSECGYVPLEKMVQAYVRAGYDFLSITDHLCLSRSVNSRITLIPGIEWNSSRGEHTGVVGRDVEPAIAKKTHKALLARQCCKDALIILNHPNWQLSPHYRREALLEKSGYDGIEIHNAIIDRLPGLAEATDKWDYLLTKNKRVLGFASDDSHELFDVGKAWIWVNAGRNEPASILRAVRQGRFYCSSGVKLDRITRVRNRVEIRSKNAKSIHMLTNGWQMEIKTGKTCVFDLPSDPKYPYARFEALGSMGEKAWTQPFFFHG